jgi:ABC-type dipeptide/oligopeptide/nickel transport system permease subunit
LGTDFLGRDVLSRLLHGGRTVVALAGLATLLAYAGGTLIGLIAGFTRSIADPLLMRAMDVLLAFPPILFLLVLATGAGATPAAVVIGIAIIQMPGIARVIRAATLETSVRGYVEAAVARGEPTWRILRREILPNIVSTIVADGGPRFTVSILLVAGLNFLGLGIRPPSADWAVMISENRTGLTVNPWAVVAPALLIGVLTVSVNLVADSIARTRGISADRDVIRR